MKYLLAHDLGTSGNKATLFRQDGLLIASAVFPYPVHYFNQIWAEQNPFDWWNAICLTSQKLVKQAGIDPQEIAAISFSGQMMGCLCVDKNGTPLRPSIIWADQRAQAQAARLNQRIPMQEFYHITGHRNTASYGLQKLMWVRDNEPEIYHATYKVLNAKDYIVFRLTGQFFTDPSDACSMGCYDINTWHWSHTILNQAEIDPDKLPQVVSSTTVVGALTAEAASATGLSAGIPVVMGAGDGVCANVGAGSIIPGRAFSYVGSSAWVASTSETPVFDPEMRTITWPHIIHGMYAPNGTMQCAGGAYGWLKEQVCRLETVQAAESGRSPYYSMDQLAGKSAPGSNGVLFLPYLLGERAPRWNPSATGSFLNLTMETTRGDLIRSVMEGVAMNLGIILDCLRSRLQISEILVIGGGAKGNIWRQIMADVYGIPVKSPRLLEEATSMGAAITAGVGCGLFPDFSIIDSWIEISSENTPDPDAVSVYRCVKKRFDAAYQALIPTYQEV